MNHRYLIVIAGCTAVGKTHLALQVAREFRTAIVSADSRQIYREMSIGVARPSSEELAAAPHFMIGSVSIGQPYDAAQYESEVLGILTQLYEQHKVVVLTGGTGLYLRAVMEGLDPLPPNDPAIMEALQEALLEKGLGPLQEELMRRDPAAAGSMDVKNPRRVLRALSVMRQTGQPISVLWKGGPAERPFVTIPVRLHLDRQELHERIHKRVDRMMEEGLLNEVTQLLPFKGLQALETVGYQELFDYLDGNCTLPEAVEWIKVHTRQYAKRQETWFKKYFIAPTFSPDAIQEIMAYLTHTIQAHEKYIWNHELTLDELNSFFKNSMGEQLGMQFIEIGPDYLKATMPVDHRTMQPMGFLHGGASVALAESLGSVGAWLAHPQGSERLILGLEINANHLKAVTKGLVTGVASPIRQGSTIQVWKIEIFDELENLICTSRITTMALKNR